MAPCIHSPVPCPPGAVAANGIFLPHANCAIRTLSADEVSALSVRAAVDYVHFGHPEVVATTTAVHQTMTSSSGWYRNRDSRSDAITVACTRAVAWKFVHQPLRGMSVQHIPVGMFLRAADVDLYRKRQRQLPAALTSDPNAGLEAMDDFDDRVEAKVLDDKRADIVNGLLGTPELPAQHAECFTSYLAACERLAGTLSGGQAQADIYAAMAEADGRSANAHKQRFYRAVRWVRNHDGGR